MEFKLLEQVGIINIRKMIIFWVKSKLDKGRREGPAGSTDKKGGTPTIVAALHFWVINYMYSSPNYY